MKYILLTIVLFFSFSAFQVSHAGNDEVELPTWAKEGDLKKEVSDKGKNGANILSTIVVVIAIIGMLVGAGYFAAGNGDTGKKFLWGGVGGLLIAASVYGIAGIMIG